MNYNQEVHYNGKITIQEICSAIEDAKKVSEMAGMKSIMTSFLTDLRDAIVDCPRLFVWFSRTTELPLMSPDLSIKVFESSELAQAMANRGVNLDTDVKAVERNEYETFFSDLYEGGVTSVDFCYSCDKAIKLDISEMFLSDDYPISENPPGSAFCVAAILAQIVRNPELEQSIYQSVIHKLKILLIANLITRPVYLPMLMKDGEEAFPGMSNEEGKIIFPIFTRKKEAETFVARMPLPMKVVGAPNAIRGIRAANAAMAVDQNAIGVLLDPLSVSLFLDKPFIRDCITNANNNSLS